ncbi:uncharacterized protein LOC130712053 [Lotus japonicus]|uniref:uncharacterized protein LOC130712053 n=1 Tax=Lotus japonicus TaxID=34305 RepID=UPI002583E393|nr:uncharacterized protein LOC130712053 [Lotus japonicus]
MDVDGSKPPDDGKLPERPSFRDKLMGGARAEAPKEVKDLVDQGRMKIQLVNGNRLLPRIVTDPSVVEEMSAPWKEALVVTLLGKTLGYRTMKLKLANVWRLNGEFDMIDVGNGFYMVKFDIKEDKEKVMNGGPWMLFDHYLAVSTWSPKFISPATRVTNTLAWVRIPGLNVVFYDESYLLSVARAIGKPIKVDRNTLKADRGRFARICVELDLTLPVVGKVCIEDYWYNIEYEGLHVICTKCGCYGHRSRDCRDSPVTTEGDQEPVPPADGGQGPNPSQETAQATNAFNQKNTEKETMEVRESSVISGEKTGNIHGLGAQSGAMENVVINLEEDFQIMGDWITVTKKKRDKKTAPKNLGHKGNIPRPDSHGVVIGKSLPRSAAQKPREEQTVNTNFMPPGAHFTFGSGSRLGHKVHGNKNKRSRVEETNGHVTDQASQPMDPGDQSLQEQGDTGLNGDGTMHESMHRSGANLDSFIQVDNATLALPG